MLSRRIAEQRDGLGGMRLRGALVQKRLHAGGCVRSAVIGPSPVSWTRYTADLMEEEPLLMQRIVCFTECALRFSAGARWIDPDTGRHEINSP